METQDVLRSGAIEYRAIYAKQKDPKTVGMVTASVTLVAASLRTGKKLWERQLDSLYGNYGERSYDELGYTVERLTLGQDNNGLSYLFVCTLGKNQFILDPLTGKDMLAHYREQFEAIPLIEDLGLRSVRMELVMIQAMPGYGVQVQVKNGARTPLMIEPAYVPFRLEGLNPASQQWEKITEVPVGDEGLETIAKNALFDLFIPAETFEALVNRAYSVFEPALKKRAKSKSSPMNIDLSRRITPTSAVTGTAFETFRLGLVLAVPGDTGGTIKGFYRTYVPLKMKMLSTLLAGDETQPKP